MKILSIDPSITTMGVAILEDRKVLKAYTFKTNPKDELEDRVKQIAEHFNSLQGLAVDVVLIEMPGTFMRRGEYAMKNVKSIQMLMLAIGVIAGTLSQYFDVQFVSVKEWKGSTKKEVTKMIAESLTDALHNEHERDAYMMAVNWQDLIRFRKATKPRKIDRFIKKDFTD